MRHQWSLWSGCVVLVLAAAACMTSEPTPPLSTPTAAVEEREAVVDFAIAYVDSDTGSLWELREGGMPIEVISDFGRRRLIGDVAQWIGPSRTLMVSEVDGALLWEPESGVLATANCGWCPGAVVGANHVIVVDASPVGYEIVALSMEDLDEESRVLTDLGEGTDVPAWVWPVALTEAGLLALVSMRPQTAVGAGAAQLMKIDLNTGASSLLLDEDGYVHPLTDSRDVGPVAASRAVDLAAIAFTPIGVDTRCGVPSMALSVVSFTGDTDLRVAPPVPPEDGHQRIEDLFWVGENLFVTTEFTPVTGDCAVSGPPQRRLYRYNWKQDVWVLDNEEGATQTRVSGLDAPERIWVFGSEDGAVLQSSSGDHPTVEVGPTSWIAGSTPALISPQIATPESTAATSGSGR